jgi:hypothetical protein
VVLSVASVAIPFKIASIFISVFAGAVNPVVFENVVASDDMYGKSEVDVDDETRSTTFKRSAGME